MACAVGSREPPARHSLPRPPCPRRLPRLAPPHAGAAAAAPAQPGPAGGGPPGGAGCTGDAHRQRAEQAALLRGVWGRRWGLSCCVCGGHRRCVWVWLQGCWVCGNACGSRAGLASAPRAGPTALPALWGRHHPPRASPFPPSPAATLAAQVRSLGSARRRRWRASPQTTARCLAATQTTTSAWASS